MSWLAAASAVLRAGSSIYGANKASDAMEGASSQANALAERVYGQQRADQMPYMKSGYQALNALNRLYGLGQVDTSVTEQMTGPMGMRLVPEKYKGRGVYVDRDGNGFVQAQYGENKGELLPIGKKFEQYAQVATPQAPQGSTGNPEQDRYGGFYASPGYQFRMDEGTRAYDRSAAARGRLLSGAQVKAQTRYGQGVASEEFNQYGNALRNIAGLGTVATNATSNAASNYGANAANAAMDSGMARASGYLGQAGAVGSIANAFAGALPYMTSNRLPGASATAYDVNGNIVNRTQYR